MDNKKAISWLKLAVPIRAVNQEDFKEFILAVNMAMNSLEAWDKVIDEIERQYQINRRVLHVDYYNVGIEQALEIINKHLDEVENG